MSSRKFECVRAWYREMERKKIRVRFQSRSESCSVWREKYAWLILDLSLALRDRRQQGTGTWSGSVPVQKLIIEQGSCWSALGGVREQSSMGVLIWKHHSFRTCFKKKKCYNILNVVVNSHVYVQSAERDMRQTHLTHDVSLFVFLI